MLHSTDQDKMEGDEPSLFHILKMVKRHETRAIRQVQDMQGNVVTSHQDVFNTFVAHLRQKYQPIAIDHSCVITLQGVIPQTCATKYADKLEQPVTSEELHSALRTEARQKAPGTDDFSLEFYTAN